VKSTIIELHVKKTMKSVGMALVAKLYQLLKGQSTCLQMVEKILSIYWNCLPEKIGRSIQREQRFDEEQAQEEER
jgi:hypothetical protein